MSRILIILACLFIAIQADAQKYRTAIGTRLGTNFGITVQQVAFKNMTVEAIFQAPIRKTDATKITLLLEKHNKLIGKRLNFYFGGGLHKGWGSSTEDPDPSGVTLIAGAEMSLGRLNLSLDYKPSINAFSGVRFLKVKAHFHSVIFWSNQRRRKSTGNFGRRGIRKGEKDRNG